jgi:uncharacterized membrane protein
MFFAPLLETAPRDNGFTLAIVIMIGMGIALLYSLIAFAIGKTFPLPKWGDWLIPVLILIGVGVAAYLSYVETQSVAALCGPVGDCIWCLTSAVIVTLLLLLGTPVAIRQFALSEDE